MQVPSLDPDLVPLLMFICLILVCILCLSCLILVIVVIRLCVHTQQSPPVKVEEKKREFKEEVKETVKKTIKKLSEPAQELFHSAQDHLKHPKQPQQQQQQQQHLTQQSIDSFCHPSSTMASHIQHLVAVAESDANTILFQVDENYKLIFYESQSPSEGLKKKYDLNTLYVDDDEIKVNEKLPVIAAVAFKHADSCQGQPQVRLYYVKHNDLTLREVYRRGGRDGEWKHGKSFNLKEYSIAEGSGLTANVFQPNDDPKKFTIKLYYQQNNKDNYADVIYNLVANDEWSTRPNVTKA